jgi:poly(A) polymerase
VVLGGTDQTDSLRLTKAEASKLRAILRVIETGMRPSAAAFEYGGEVARAGALAIAALCESHPPSDLDAAIARGEGAAFPIRAKDLAPLAGKELGEALSMLRERWIASEFELSKEALLK